MRVSYTKVTVVEKQQVSRDTFFEKTVNTGTPAWPHLFEGPSYRISDAPKVHFIGIQEYVFCILSEFVYFYYLCINYLRKEMIDERIILTASPRSNSLKLAET